MEIKYLKRRTKRSEFKNSLKKSPKCASGLIFADEIRDYYSDNASSTGISEENSDNDNDDRCPICFETIIQIGITDCLHRFCFMCIYNWTFKTLNCPVCRSSIDKLSYFRRDTKLSIEIKEKKYDKSCYICKNIKKIDPNKDKNNLISCACGMYFHHNCDKVISFEKINPYTGQIRCFDCMIFYLEMKSIDKISK